MKKYIIIYFLFFLQSCQDCDPVDVSYEVDVPYTIIEKNELKLEYVIYNKYIYIRRHDGLILFGANPSMEVYAIVTNISEYGGNFELYAYMSSQGDRMEFRDRKYIFPGKTDTIRIVKGLNPFTFMANVVIDDWGLISPTITVNKEVTKYKSVTKYKKCNPCEEDCGSHSSSNMPSWLVITILIGGVGIIAVIAKIVNAPST